MSNPTRLLVLGLLAGDGPMHGHQLRRRAELLNVGEWGEVRIGSLYSGIHRMEDEGLILPLRREQSGNFPARTVYEITDEGRRELSVLRQEALQGAALRADPVDVALIVSAGFSESELRSLLDTRHRTLAATLARYAAERARLEKSGFLRPAARAVFRHWEERLQAELRWHSELGETLGTISSDLTPPSDAATTERKTRPAKPSESAREPAPRRKAKTQGKPRTKK